MQLRAHKAVVFGCLRHCLLAGLQDVGGVVGQSAEKGLARAQEDTGIPQHTACEKQGFGLVLGWLFCKTFDVGGAVWACAPFADVALGGAWKSGSDSICDDGALLSNNNALLDH